MHILSYFNLSFENNLSADSILRLSISSAIERCKSDHSAGIDDLSTIHLFSEKIIHELSKDIAIDLDFFQIPNLYDLVIYLRNKYFLLSTSFVIRSKIEFDEQDVRSIIELQQPLYEHFMSIRNHRQSLQKVKTYVIGEYQFVEKNKIEIAKSRSSKIIPFAEEQIEEQKEDRAIKERKTDEISIPMNIGFDFHFPPSAEEFQSIFFEYTPQSISTILKDEVMQSVIRAMPSQSTVASFILELRTSLQRLFHLSFDFTPASFQPKTYEIFLEQVQVAIHIAETNSIPSLKFLFQEIKKIFTLLQTKKIALDRIFIQQVQNILEKVSNSISFLDRNKEHPFSFDAEVETLFDYAEIKASMSPMQEESSKKESSLRIAHSTSEETPIHKSIIEKESSITDFYKTKTIQNDTEIKQLKLLLETISIETNQLERKFKKTQDTLQTSIAANPSEINQLILANQISVKKISTLVSSAYKHSNQFQLIELYSSLQPLQKFAKEIATSQGKMVEFHIHQSGVKVEDCIAQKIFEPIKELLMNAIIHGIELPEARLQKRKTEIGNIKIQYGTVGKNLILQFEDDGAGINYNAVERKAVQQGLLNSQFSILRREPERCFDILATKGFSVSSLPDSLQFEGNGLGRVREVVSEMKGNIFMNASENGVRYTMTIPLEVCNDFVFTVQTDTGVFAIPIYQIEKIALLSQSDIHFHPTKNKVIHQGKEIDLVQFSELMGSMASPISKNSWMMILRNTNPSQGILVQKILHRKEVFIDKSPELITGLYGTMFSETGEIIPIMDVTELARKKYLQTSASVSELFHNRKPESKSSPIPVLYVNGSYLKTKYFKMSMENTTLQITSTSHFKEAKELATQNRYHVIVIDLEEIDKVDLHSMKNSSTQVLLEQLRGMFSATIPILIISNYSSASIFTDKKIGLMKMIEKPVSKEMILTEIENILS